MSREGISHDDLVDNAQVFHLDQKPVEDGKGRSAGPCVCYGRVLVQSPVEATRLTCLLLSASQQHYAASAILQNEMP